MPSIDKETPPVLHLECGSSLAELEYATEAQYKDDERQNEDTTTSFVPIKSNTTHLNMPTLEESKDASTIPPSSSGTSLTLAHIQSLRRSLVHDIVKEPSLSPSSIVSTFTSPFETPSASIHKSSIGGSISSTKAISSTNGSADRYTKVPLIYCDQTASNRPLASIERYIQNVCLPLYGNTHTNTSITGSQSTAFVAEARQVVAESVNAKISGKASVDTVLFTGSGTTGAVELLIDCLGISQQDEYMRNPDSRPVVFIGPHEHHSNILPWRESGCEIVMIGEHSTSHIVDYDQLEQKLVEYSTKYPERLLMGTFTAASNVNGAVTDVDRIAATLHTYGALAFFDYATGASYLPINMNPGTPSASTSSSSNIDYTQSNISKDAVYLSPHKMIGGVNTPGVLIIKKRLVNQTNAPHRSGGGTVFYVTHDHHRFLSNRIERFEGGTPNVVGIIRVGLTFLAQRQLAAKYRSIISMSTSDDDDTFRSSLPKSLLDYDYYIHQYACKRLRKNAPNLILLGCPASDSDVKASRHLPIFSFLIKCGNRFLHYNYVCAILNDLFGIQSRGGCQCSGPYSQRLLGLTVMCNDKNIEHPSDVNGKIETALMHYKERAELLRPGYTRLSLPFKGLQQEEVDYVLEALEWVAKNGWALMCQYRCNHRTGEWRHFSRQGKPLGRTERRWLSHYDLEYRENFGADGIKNNATEEASGAKGLQEILNDAMLNAEYQLKNAKKDPVSISQAFKMSNESMILGGNGGDNELEALRWYVYPKEVAQLLTSDNTLEMFPGTHDFNVLGAIRPLTYFGEQEKVTKSNEKTNENTGIIACDRECDQVALCVNRSDGTLSGILTDLEKDKMYSFRDGDNHQGQAHLEDIILGYEDEELSDDCIIYVSDDDTWHKVKDIVEVSKRKGENATATTDNRIVKSSDADFDRHAVSMNCHDSCHLPTITNIKNDSNPKPAVRDLKREQKKPSRDSSTWGRNHQTTVSLQDTAHSRVSIDPSLPDSDESKEKQVTNNILAQPKAKRKKQNFLKPPAKLTKYIIQAIVQWDMIKDGDRLLLGLSGGKDSLSLLHCLLEYKRKMPTKFDLEVCTIDPMTSSFDPSPMIPYVKSLGLRYHYIKDDIVSRAAKSGKDGKVVTSLCAYCARMKRGLLYQCARANKCNKLVLAQHLDDCAESLIMSLMHNGFIRTMKANYEINAGDISVIRPMVYCRESLMTSFAKEASLPIINENCPACFEEPKERDRVKKLLSREETLYPNLYDNLRRALIPIMHDDTTAILRAYTEEAVKKSRRNKGSTTKTKSGKRKEPSTVANDDTNTDNNASGADCASTEVTVTSKGNETEMTLSNFSEEELLLELSRRKAKKFKLSGSYSANKRMKNGASVTDDDGIDPTGQVCTLDGRNGTIRCTELME